MALSMEFLSECSKALNSKFYKPELLDASWRDAIESHRQGIEAAPTHDAFELAVTSLLQTLKTSHLGFFHGTAKRASSRAALSATYLEDETANGSRWIFQDVHEGGSAALAGIQSGNILLRVDGKEIVPPEHPVFPMGASSTIDFIANDGHKRRVSVDVAQPKGKKLQFVEPTPCAVQGAERGCRLPQGCSFENYLGSSVHLVILFSASVRG